jgi:hypothetical protein
MFFITVQTESSLFLLGECDSPGSSNIFPKSFASNRIDFEFIKGDMFSLGGQRH